MIAPLSPLRLRRLARQEQLKNQQKLITFQLGTYSFGLPVERAGRVLAWQDFGVLREPPDEEELSLLDTARLLLGRGLPFHPQSVILLQRPTLQEHWQRLALPIPTQPLLRRLPAAQLQPLPSRYAAQARQRGIVQWVPPGQDPLPLLLFDPHLWADADLPLLGRQGGQLQVGVLQAD